MAESILRGVNPAEPVGVGVHRQKVVPGPKPESHLPKEPEVLSLDGEERWEDTPTYPDQLSRGPQYWKLDKVDVKVFDLSQPDQAKDYAELLTQSNKPGTNKVLIAQERKFSEDTHSWKVLVEIQYIKFRKLLKKKDDEKAG